MIGRPAGLVAWMPHEIGDCLVWSTASLIVQMPPAGLVDNLPISGLANRTCWIYTGPLSELAHLVQSFLLRSWPDRTYHRLGLLSVADIHRCETQPSGNPLSPTGRMK